MIRAFVAVPLPDDVRRALMLLEMGLPGFRGVPEENLHLTLAFLGEQREDVLEDLHSELSGVRLAPFSLRIAGLGHFGGAEPRAIWAGVGDSPALRLLQSKVATAARRAGIALAAQRFVPHVTLFRLKPGDPAAAALGFVAQRGDFASETFTVREFVLFRSRLLKQGPVYEDLARYPLD